MGDLMLSVIIFAPGLVLLTIFSLIGILMILEKAGVLGKVDLESPKDDNSSNDNSSSEKE